MQPYNGEGTLNNVFHVVSENTMSVMCTMYGHHIPRTLLVCFSKKMVGTMLED